MKKKGKKETRKEGRKGTRKEGKKREGRKRKEKKDSRILKEPAESLGTQWIVL